MPVVSTGALLLLLALHLLVPGAVEAVALPLAVGGLLLGLPHGAVDHMVPFWLTGERATPRRLVPVLASYLLVAALAAAALLSAPNIAVSAFLLASALHFGRGDVVASAERAGRAVPKWHEDAVLALAHGAVVVVLPYALWHEQSAPVLRQLAPALADPPAAVLTGLLLATCALVVAAAARLLLRRRWLELGELTVLATCFAVVPPLAAFGVYFGLWHAGRHTSRMVELAARWAPPGAAPGWALRRYLLHAAAPTVVALAALVAIAVTDDASVLTAELAVLLALTFPHLQTVAALDAAQSTRATGG